MFLEGMCGAWNGHLRGITERSFEYDALRLFAYGESGEHRASFLLFAYIESVVFLCWK